MFFLQEKFLYLFIYFFTYFNGLRNGLSKWQLSIELVVFTFYSYTFTQKQPLKGVQLKSVFIIFRSHMMLDKTLAKFRKNNFEGVSPL